MPNRREADELLIHGLASGLAVEDAARKAGVSKSTAHRRLREEEFCARVKQERAGMLERAQGVLSACASSASVTLGELLKSTNEKTRLAAAKSILETAVRMKDSIELEESIAALEQAALRRRGKA
jgi:hypothetical protein